jgi:hypothetical protein
VTKKVVGAFGTFFAPLQLDHRATLAPLTGKESAGEIKA